MFSNRYVCRNKLIVKEVVQPLFCQIIMNYNGEMIPVYLNHSAAEVLRLCDGSKTVNDIHKILADKYNEPVSEIEKKLSTFWEFAYAVGHIEFSDVKCKISNIYNLEGSKDYWTPELLSVEITHKCPLACKHCFLSAGNGNVMKAETWKKIIDNVKEMYIPQVQLTGGEPLTHMHFFDMVDELVNMGVIVHVFTSGVIDSDDIIRKFEKYKNTDGRLLFQVSLDGLMETHDRFRGVKGSFKRSTNFLERIIAMGFKATVGVTISDQSFEEIVELCEYCKLIGVQIVRIGGIMELGRAKENELCTDENNYTDIINIKTRLAERLNDDSFKVMLTEEKNGDELEKKYIMNCGLGQTTLKIDPLGNIYPCMMASDAYANINHDTLIDVQKKYSREFEKLVPPSYSECGNCKKKDVCNKCIVEGQINSVVKNCNWAKLNIEKLELCFKRKADND